MFLHLLVLDEATSSLSEEDEDYFYNLLHQMGTTFLTIGHRSSVKKVIKVIHIHLDLRKCS